MLPSHQRNRAERAAVIAAFADLEIANVRQIARVNAHTWVEHFRVRGKKSALDQLRDEPVALRRAQKQIHFWQLGGELSSVSLDHASHRNDRATLATLLM